MENEKQIKLLAETALQGQNYKQAFNYYSKLLENNPENQTYWIGKAIATANLSSVEIPRVKEAVAYMQAAMNLDAIPEDEKLQVADELTRIGKQKIIAGLIAIDKETERRFNGKQMGTFTVYEAHKMNRIVIELQVGKEYRNGLTDHFDLLELAYQLSPTKEHIETLLDTMETVLTHSKSHQNYFGALNELTEENKRISHLWNNAKSTLAKISPENSSRYDTPHIQNSEGCFIATAAAGSYTHPDVLRLRYFRDNTLVHHSWGRRFIQFYYHHSPRLAAYIKTRKVLRKLIYFIFIKPLSFFVGIFK